MKVPSWFFCGVIVASVAACTAAQLNAAVAKGQLYCSKATATGPLVVALADMFGAPVIATGAAASLVTADCAAIGAIPVSPPPVPSQAPVVSAPGVVATAATVTPPVTAPAKLP